MKLNEEKPFYETSEDIDEKFFSIEDHGMIFDILRNKMYSNCILAICREISCNARDAHREVGKSDIPIQIHLPNRLEPFFKVKDFGPGISPERMNDVFIKYAASTKRNDNTQTGGFGLGAKTPFSYSDSFSIITNINGIKYNYGCAIDPTKVGKLVLFSTSPTTEPNGTEIIIPVKTGDFNNFATWTEVATRYWKVKPIIKGGINTFEWETITKSLEGPNWTLCISNNWNKSIKIIVDDIEYSLDTDVLRNFANSKIIDSTKGNVLLHFNTGEISLSANREQIYLDKQTKINILCRLNEVEKEIFNIVQHKVNSFPNLWEAHIYIQNELIKSFNNYNLFDNLSWQGIKVFTSDLYLGCNIYAFIKGKYSRRNGTDPNKITRITLQRLNFNENSLLVINNSSIKDPSIKHIKKAFDDDSTLKKLYLVCPNDNVTYDNLVDTYHLDKMNPVLLSSLTKITNKVYTTNKIRLLVYKYDLLTNSFRHVSVDSIKEDTNKKVLCKINKEYNNIYIVENNIKMSQIVMEKLASTFSNISFYGVNESIPLDRVTSHFHNCQKFSDFIENDVFDQNIDFTQIKYVKSIHHLLDSKLLSDYHFYKENILDTDSFFLKRLEIHKNFNSLKDKFVLLSLFENMKHYIDDNEIATWLKDHKEFDIENQNDIYLNKYPLLQYIYSNYCRTQHIAQYINLIDKDSK